MRSKHEAPHRVLDEYYAQESERGPFVQGLFDRTAQYYDRIVAFTFLGSGNWGRRRALSQGGVASGAKVLDVAVGTGLLARQTRDLVGPEGEVIGLDRSRGMLAQVHNNVTIPLVQGMGEHLPVCANRFDFVTIGYALRHFADLEHTFSECRRVLRENGKLLVMEVSRPSPKFGETLLRWYLGRIVPAVCRWTKGRRNSEELMRYHWETVAHCVPPEKIVQAMRNAGFDNVSCLTELGIFRLFSGEKTHA